MSDQTRIVKMWCHWLEFHYEYLMINWLAGRWENSLQTCFMREPFLLMCFIEWIFSYRLGSWGSCFTKYFLVDSQINISDEKVWLIPGLIGRWRRCQVCILWDSAVIQDKNWASDHRYYKFTLNKWNNGCDNRFIMLLLKHDSNLNKEQSVVTVHHY